VAINPAGTEAFVTNQHSRTIGVVDIASRSQVATIPLGHDPFVVSFAPDGSRAFVTTNDGVVYAINPATRAVVDSVLTGHGSNGLALSPDATKLYVSAFAAGTVHEVNLATFTVARTFNTGGAPQGLVVAPDGAELYVANEAGRIEVWNLASGTHTTSITLPGSAFDLTMSPDGSRLAAGLMFSGAVSIVNRQTRSIVRTTTTGGSPRRMKFSADGLTLVVANEAGWIDFIQ
jgi:YVTN family beta-propeller protein